MSTQQHTRTLLGPADPVRTMPAVPPGPPAHQLIALAGAAPARLSRHRPAGRPTRRLVLSAGAAALAAGAVGVTLATRSRHNPAAGGDNSAAGPAAGAVLVPIAYQYATGASPAASRLRALAASIGDAPYDTQTGRYAYHHTRSWGGGLMLSPGGRYRVALADDIRAWLAADGSGRQITTQLQPQYPDQASRDYWAPRLTGAYAPGGTSTLSFPPGYTEPLPTDRAGLSGMLQVSNGPGAMPKFVAMVYSRYAVPRRTRALIVTILADVPGYLWRGEVTDRAGRAGVAITYTDTTHGYQHLLIFDRRTGVLLAEEMLGTITPTTGGSMRVDAYQIILDTTRTDRLA